MDRVMLLNLLQSLTALLVHQEETQADHYQAIFTLLEEFERIING